MAILVILVLGILWAAVLLPPILRSRNESGAPGGIGDFVGRLRSGLGQGRGPDAGLPPLTPIMGPVGGIGPIGPNGNPLGPVSVRGAMTPAQRRRRDVLVGLLGAAGLTFFMALFAGSVVFWLLHLLADALVGGYVYMLLQLKAKNVERRPAPMPAPRRADFPGVPDMVPTNVAHLSAHRPRPAVVASHVDAPRDATVLALRRTASW